MTTFAYTAKDAHGATVEGMIEAQNERAAVTALRDHKLFPVSLKQKAEATASVLSQFRFLKFAQHFEIVGFTRQLATMVEAGLTLTEALTILREQTKNPDMQRMVAQIIRDIDGGMSFADALDRHQETFSMVFISLVRAGESAGVLDKVLTRLSENLEKERDFRSKVKGAMIYPVIVITAMIGVVIVMMVFVLPRLTSLFGELGSSLPLPTRILIGASSFMVAYWYILAGFFVGGAIWLRWWGKTDVGRRAVDRFRLRVPLFGAILENVVLAEFTRTLSLLITAGIPIIEGLTTVARALENVLYQDAIMQASREVERGTPLATPISREPIFPPIVGQMIRTGESTGKLDVLLLRLSSYFESEAEHQIRGLTAAIEPIIMIILGLGVAFLVMAVILPIYQITSAF
ncbi:MAG: type II secretion system F family protein [bacterium]|nr:type II secretion system F family protein [bacterium]